MTKSLRENLKFKTVIEYPAFHVVLKDHCHNYPLKGPGESPFVLSVTREVVWMTLFLMEDYTLDI